VPARGLVAKSLVGEASGSIDSLLDLLRGRFDRGVMERLTEREHGLFPQPKEIKMKCSCPDRAGMCKHVAATLYGVGARLDSDPELLFALRNVDHLELIGQAVAAENLEQTLTANPSEGLVGADLSELFGIDIDAGMSDRSVSVAVESKKAPRKTGAATKETGLKETNAQSASLAAAKSKRAAKSTPRTRRRR
jgi:uncharacterized Zn finger protein